MKKLWLIIQREYMSRVTKKAFILGTILTPLLIGGLIFLQVKLVGYKDDNFKRIAVLDESGILKKAPDNQKNIHFSLFTEGLDKAKKQVVEKQFNGVLVIPKIEDATSQRFTIKYYSDEKLGNDMSDDIESKIEDFIKDYKVSTLGLDTTKIKALKTRIEIDPDPIEGDEDASTVSGLVAMAIGGMMGFFMYLSVFIYGMMIFRSVMEEKTSRIVEVMISSVKPFQLMLGKIIGVGAVGFTQFVIWFILIGLIMTGISTMIGTDSAQIAASNPQMNATMQGVQEVQAGGKMELALTELQNQNWWLILPMFFIFFLLGYFMYASLFAAVGSAVGDDQGEAQSLTLPITIPVIVAIYIMMAAVRSPDSSLAVWSSIFPLFSPIVMPARLPFHPPAWQIALSLTFLVATVIGLVWIAGRIYRIGILMYGKKVTFKELGKWLFYKD
ncbi:MAG: ABC transporter permease [Saprospiraceae bacterium]|nr:ABC transporter permease [Saprospiraceae bacterium]